MIQDIGSQQFSNVWRQCEPSAADKVYCFAGRDTLLDKNGEPPRYRDLQALEGIEYRFLFDLDDSPCFLAVSEEKIELEGFAYEMARNFRFHKPMGRALAGFTAIHLNGWYRSNRFCGRCGKKMVPGTDERKMVCPACHNLVYPRMNPAVIVALTDGERLMMTRYNGRTHAVRHYVLIAGFVEIGETAEECVAREVMEEVGLKVKNVRYFGSQPWGCDGNLTLAYFAELDRSGGDKVHVDLEELSDGRWFERHEVPVPNDDVSITSEMIHCFAAGTEKERLFK